MNHHRSEDIRGLQHLQSLAAGDPFSCSHSIEFVDILSQFGERGLIDEFDAVKIDAQLCGGGGHGLFFADENWSRDMLVYKQLSSAENTRIVTFGEDHALRLALRFVDHNAHNFTRFA